ncbi:MAG: BamA/TamA family outer membrane protein [Acidobacteriota bacterium]
MTLLCLVLTGFLFGSVATGPAGSEAKKEGSEKKTGLLFIPVVFYTPETHLAFGGGGLYYFDLAKDQAVTRPSNIAGIAVYTQKKQFSLELNPDLYLRHGYHLQFTLNASKFPDKFYGVGNATAEELEEDYTSRYLKLTVEALKLTYRALNIGFQYFYDHYHVVEKKAGGLLASGIVPGSKGGIVSGLGYLMTWDSRNSIFFPTSGSFHTFSATFFGSAMGSDFPFSRFYFDLRRYFPLAKAQTLALQTRLLFQPGDPPFWRMAQLGGEEIMRGYYQGRYRDKNMICFQAEYRWVPLLWRLGMVGFIGVGEVADTLSHFDLGGVKYSYGVGLRYLFSREQGVTIRLDFGFGKDTSGVYLTAAEAF